MARDNFTKDCTIEDIVMPRAVRVWYVSTSSQVSESTALMFQELEGKEDERGDARQTMINYAKAAMEDQGGEVDNLKDVTKADLFKATEDVELEWVIPGELPTSYMLKAIKRDVEDEESEQWAMTVE